MDDILSISEVKWLGKGSKETPVFFNKRCLVALPKFMAVAEEVHFEDLTEERYGVVIGSALAQQLNLLPGEKIELTLPRVFVTPFANCYILIQMLNKSIHMYNKSFFVINILFKCFK